MGREGENVALRASGTILDPSWNCGDAGFCGRNKSSSGDTGTNGGEKVEWGKVSGAVVLGKNGSWHLRPLAPPPADFGANGASQPLACFFRGHGLLTQSSLQCLPEPRIVLQQPVNQIIALGQGSQLESRRAVDSHDHRLVMAQAAIAT